MNESQCVTLLEQHGIKPTANRIVVLKALANATRPLSLTELEYQILTIDKSGVFRALTLFREHGLVHVLEGSTDGVHYELCHSHNDDYDDDLHVHFHCEQCHRTFCLEEIPIPPVTLPEGFAMTSINYMMKGICPDCQAIIWPIRGK